MTPSISHSITHDVLHNHESQLGNSHKNKKWPAPKIRLCPIEGAQTSSAKERKSLRTKERRERISVRRNSRSSGRQHWFLPD